MIRVNIIIRREMRCGDLISLQRDLVSSDFHEFVGFIILWQKADPHLQRGK